jgi:hypothetical protein
MDSNPVGFKIGHERDRDANFCIDHSLNFARNKHVKNWQYGNTRKSKARTIQRENSFEKIFMKMTFSGGYREPVRGW